jgi:glycosyltransferase involved in cell wall biosynthesis
MKIALDLRRIRNPGIGRYMRCLTEALLAVAPEHEYLLILSADGVDLIAADSPRVIKIASELKYYSLREQVEIPRILRQHNVDLFHSPHFNIPLLCPCACVATIHDVIYLACPEDLPSRAGRLYYRAMMYAAIRAVDGVITDSGFSRQEIRRYLKTNREIQVIHPAVDARFRPITDCGTLRDVKARYGITGEYVLYTGIFKARKNHAGLLRAFRRSLDDYSDARLVLAGPLDEGERELRALAEQLNIADRVVFTGFVEDSDLQALYSSARVYACPSLYEGFGFTILEAMACGIPVVCSAEASLPEIGGDAALYADARDPEQFGRALCRAFTDANLRTAMVEKGRANVDRFTWRSTALQTLAVYQRTLGVPATNVVAPKDNREPALVSSRDSGGAG